MHRVVGESSSRGQKCPNLAGGKGRKKELQDPVKWMCAIGADCARGKN